jgi:pimeloyl-ACP methyl ester carboxylesterase
MTDLHLEVYGEGESTIFVHGTFGWGLDTFPHQRALADGYRVILVDRRGFGNSPTTDQVGWHVDMHDIAGLLAEVGGAHLVGQSYGAVVCLLAAGLRPDLVHSLVAIEPVAFEVAKGRDAVDESIRALKPVYERAGLMTAEEFYRAWRQARGASDERVNQDMAAMSPKDWAAVEASRKERWPGDAPIPVDILAAARFPKVLVRGAWPPESFPGREAVAQAHREVCEVIAQAIGSSVVVFKDSAHNPQMQEPEQFNDLLRDIWRSARPH